MKTTLLMRRAVVAAALMGVAFSPRAGSAQSELDSSQAQAFMGDWVVSLSTEFGAFDLDLKIEDQDGKVAASIGSPDPAAGGMAAVTDIRRSGEALVLSYDVDAQGQVVPVSVMLTTEGEGLKAAFDFGGQFAAEGSATRARN